MHPLTTGIPCGLRRLRHRRLGRRPPRLGSNTVTATVVNASGREIDRAHIEFATCHLKGAAIVGRLGAGDRRTLRYHLCGEDAYVLDVHFADGRHLRSGGGYPERGYQMLDVVRPDRVVSTQSLY